MRRSIVLLVLATGLILAGCHPERRRITPTTLGTDLKRMPRGTMRAYAWPGQDLVKVGPTGRGTIDPAAAMASGEAVER